MTDKKDPGGDAKTNVNATTNADPNSDAEKAKAAKLAADTKAAEDAAKEQARKDAEEDAKAAAELEAKQKEADAQTLSVKDLEKTLGGQLANEPADPAIDEDRMVRAKASAEKLQNLVAAISPTTPRDHVMFGFAGITVNVGDLRNLFDPA